MTFIYTCKFYCPCYSSSVNTLMRSLKRELLYRSIFSWHIIPGNIWDLIQDTSQAYVFFISGWTHLSPLGLLLGLNGCLPEFHCSLSHFLPSPLYLPWPFNRSQRCIVFWKVFLPNPAFFVIYLKSLYSQQICWIYNSVLASIFGEPNLLVLFFFICHMLSFHSKQMNKWRKKESYIKK